MHNGSRTMQYSDYRSAYRLAYSLIAALVMFALTAGHGYAQGEGLVTAVQSDVNLRVCAGTEWRRLTTLPTGMNIALDGRISDNSWVRGITQDGDLGWVFANALNIDAGQISSLPVINCGDPITVNTPPPGQIVSAPAATDPVEEAPQAAPPVAAQGGSGLSIVVPRNTNVRSGPGTTFRRVGGMVGGETFLVDGHDGDLNWVRGVTPRGEVGWVAANLTNITLDQILSLPVVGVNTPFTLAVPDAPQQTAPEAAPEIAAPPPVASTAPVRGFSYGGHVRSFSNTTVQAMYQSGMTWVKKQIRFAPGENPAGWSGFINEAHALGFRVLLGVVSDPNTVRDPNFYDVYANYVAGLAAIGADAIEIWNEPNIDREWASGFISGSAYTQLLARSYNAIKSVNPNTMVISGAPAPTGFFGGCSPAGCDDIPFLQQMAAAGAANYMDCVGVHYNEGILPPSATSGDPRQPSNFHTRYYARMVDVYWGAFGGRHPLCFTELGYLTPEGYGPLPGGFAWAGGTSVAQQAAWLDQAMSLASRSGRVRVIIVWNVDFTGVYGDDPMGGYAIIRPDGSCPACAALGN